MLFSFGQECHVFAVFVLQTLNQGGQIKFENSRFEGKECFTLKSKQRTAGGTQNGTLHSNSNHNKIFLFFFVCLFVCLFVCVFFVNDSYMSRGSVPVRLEMFFVSPSLVLVTFLSVSLVCILVAFFPSFFVRISLACVS